MRRSWALALVGALASACATSSPTGAPPAAGPIDGVVEGLGWLEGSWRLDDGSRRVEEQWSSPAGGLLLGTGRTLEGGRLRSYEAMTIRGEGDRVVLFAQPSDQPGTAFFLVEHTERRAVFENLEHDYPKRITYARVDATTLTAIVEGDPSSPKLELEYRRVLPDETAATAGTTLADEGSSPDAAMRQLCGGPNAIPMRIEGSRHYVHVGLPGRAGVEAVRFHVDTGGNTPGLTIHKSVLRQLGLREDDLPTELAFGARRVAVPRGATWQVIDDVSADAAARSGAHPARRPNRVAGQIGAGFLSRFLVCIDPAAGRLGLGDPRELRVDPGQQPFIPLMLLAGGRNAALYPFVAVGVDEKYPPAPEPARRHGLKAIGGIGPPRGEDRSFATFAMLLDTGATSSMLEAEALDTLTARFPKWGLTRGSAGDADMIGGQFDERMLRVPEVTVTAPPPLAYQVGLWRVPRVDASPGTFVERPNGTFENMFGLTPYVRAKGALANDVLNRYRLLIDYRESRLWMVPVERSEDPSASSTRVGLSLAFGTDGCPIIRRISDRNDPKTKQALRLGDALLTVDGRDSCSAFHHEISAQLAGRAGDSRKLTVRRGTQEIDVTVPVTDLLARRP